MLVAVLTIGGATWPTREAVAADGAACAKNVKRAPESLDSRYTVLCGFFYASGDSSARYYDQTLVRTHASRISEQLTKARTYTVYGYADVRCMPELRGTQWCKKGSTTGTTPYNTTLSRARARTLITELSRFVPAAKWKRATFEVEALGERYAAAQLWQCASAPDEDPCAADRHADLVLTPGVPPTTTTTTTPPERNPSATVSSSVKVPSFVQRGSVVAFPFQPVSVSCRECSTPPSSGAARSGWYTPRVVSVEFSMAPSSAITPPTGYTWRFVSGPSGTANSGQSLKAVFDKATRAGETYLLRPGRATVTLEYDKWVWNGRTLSVLGARFSETTTVSVSCASTCSFGVLGTNLG